MERSMIHQRKTRVVDSCVPNMAVNHRPCRESRRCHGYGSRGALRPNMRMQLTRPRDRWPAAERWTSASLHLIRGR